MKKISMMIMLVCTLAFFSSGCGVVGIEDGQRGVQADFGKIQEESIGTGWHFYFPLFTWIETWNVKTQELKETSNVPSSEGLISQIDVSILYHIPADKVVFVRKSIGNEYKDTVLAPYVRESIRNIISGYEVKSLYSEAGRKEIGIKIEAFLQKKLESRGIVIEDVLLRDVRLPPTFSLSIESKLKAEQEALQKQFELQKAEKDAEIEVVKARGTAQANKIVGDSISENYLRYLWINGLQTNNMQVIYVPTEGNIPIMEANRFRGNTTK